MNRSFPNIEAAAPGHNRSAFSNDGERWTLRAERNRHGKPVAWEAYAQTGPHSQKATGYIRAASLAAMSAALEGFA